MRAVQALRAAVTVLLLLVTAACGTSTATGFLVLADAVGGFDGWGDVLRDLFLTGAGLAALCAVPAVVALWLRARHPVASGTVATLVGAVAVGVWRTPGRGLRLRVAGHLGRAAVDGVRRAAPAAGDGR